MLYGTQFRRSSDSYDDIVLLNQFWLFQNKRILCSHSRWLRRVTLLKIVTNIGRFLGLRHYLQISIDGGLKTFLLWGTVHKVVCLKFVHQRLKTRTFDKHVGLAFGSISYVTSWVIH